MIPIYSQQDDLVVKDKTLLNILNWATPALYNVQLVKAFKCNLNKGVLDDNLLTANIYVDDILAVAAYKARMVRLLAAIIEAIFFDLWCAGHVCTPMPPLTQKVGRTYGRPKADCAWFSC